MRLKVTITEAMVDAGARAAYAVEIEGEPPGARRASWDEANPDVRRVHLIQTRAALVAAVAVR